MSNDMHQLHHQSNEAFARRLYIELRHLRRRLGGISQAFKTLARRPLAPGYAARPADTGADIKRGKEKMINLTLPWPPSTNDYYRNVNGKTLISAKGREYRIAVAEQVQIQHGAKHYSGRLEVDIVAHVPDKRRRDLDNMLKAALDGLTHAGVWADDSLIDSLSIKRGPIGGMLKVCVSIL